MRPYVPTVISGLLALSTLSLPATGAPPASRTWLERPWEIRYVLFSASVRGMQIRVEAAKKINAEQLDSKKERIYLSAAALFEPSTTLAVPDARPIAIVVLAFNRAGRIVNQHGPLGDMLAKQSVLGNLALIPSGRPGANPYYFADWSQGIPGDVTFSPAVCSSEDRFRYQDDWSRSDPSGNFGCREWTAQLYARDQPYIDVTSWSPRGTHIGEVVGWSRFEDPPKPVIGRHGKTWLCLHECPAGEQPGVIPDIRAWTAKHRFPMPERPRKQPLYPNADYKDDLNEFND